jgi:predicted dehydrogenase
VSVVPGDGAWWKRRPSSNIDIPLADPLQVEVVALCDADEARLQRVGMAARIPSLYADWRKMLAEHAPGLGSGGGPGLSVAVGGHGELDALFLALPPAQTDEILCALATRRLHHAAPWLWLAGPPALSSARARELATLHAHRVAWCARPVAHALAHRAARHLIRRGDIGTVRAVHLRWHTPLAPPLSAADSSGDGARAPSLASPAWESRVAQGELAASCAAVDLLLEFAAPESVRGDAATLDRVVSAAVAHENGGATSALVQFANGVPATLLAGAGDEWNAPLPRLEIVGTQGRFLVCEGGGDLRLHAPREATQSWSAPSGVPALSGAEASGVAPDARAFLHACAGGRYRTARSSGASTGALGSEDEESRALLAAHSLGRAALVLQLWEALAARQSPASNFAPPAATSLGASGTPSHSRGPASVLAFEHRDAAGTARDANGIAAADDSAPPERAASPSGRPPAPGSALSEPPSSHWTLSLPFEPD